MQDFFSSIEMHDDPFDYFVSPRALESTKSDSLLSWLEHRAPWNLKKASFYEQYEFSFWDAQLPAELNDLCDGTFTSAARTHMGRLFDTPFADQIDFTAHKLVPGQKIRVHNDYRPQGETHRLLIQLNRGWNVDKGGLLMLFSSESASDVRRVYNPTHNSSLGFAISPHSYHAVSPIKAGERYTVVLSFYAAHATGA